MRSKIGKGGAGGLLVPAVVLALLVLLGAAATGLAARGASTAGTAGGETDTPVTTPSYAANTSGTTYGHLPTTDTPVAQSEMPDLVAVVASNGQEGYAYRDELFGPDDPPSTPEEAAKVSARPHYIDVYLSDGTSVIGQFLVGGGSPTN